MERMAKDVQVSFMTWNIYQGFDPTPIFTAAPAQIPQRVTEVFRQFLATDFPERANAIAGQIASKKPDFVGLQEAVLVQLMVPDFPVVTYDFVQLLLSALRNVGQHYEVAAVNENVSLQLPTSTGNTVSLLDRDVILLRKGSGLKIIKKQEANFTTNATVIIGGQPYVIVDGWSSVDVQVKKRVFRLINTHLSPISQAVQVAQGNELLTGPANTNLPLVMMGDFNSNAGGSGTPTYMNFIDAGFQDAWVEAGVGDGFSCCQDSDVLNAVSTLGRRIDFILFKNGWNALAADVVGEEQDDRTPTALWPSDHAGVAATLTLKKKLG